MINKNLQVYKTTELNKTTYYYYAEKKVYVNLLAYCCGWNIIFGTMWICHHVALWLLVGTSINSVADIISLVWTLLWLFLVHINIKTLLAQGYKVQVLKKTVIEDKDGNKIENCF